MTPYRRLLLILATLSIAPPLAAHVYLLVTHDEVMLWRLLGVLPFQFAVWGAFGLALIGGATKWVVDAIRSRRQK